MKYWLWLLVLVSCQTAQAQVVQNPNAEGKDAELEPLAVTLLSFSEQTLTLRAAPSGSQGVRFKLLSKPDCCTVTLRDEVAGTVHLAAAQLTPGTQTFTYERADSQGTARGSVVLTLQQTPGIGGQLTYEDVPTASSAEGQPYLDYAASQKRPLRLVTVQLRRAADGTSIIAETATDLQGHYRFPRSAGEDVVIVALSQSASPNVQVLNNYDPEGTGRVVYALQSRPLSPNQTIDINLNAPHGYDNGSYTERRSSGPFAILDRFIGLALQFTAQRPGIVWQPLRANWSPMNSPQAGNPNLGRITTSHWDGSQLYLLGLADLDTDEFDSHVLLHEWGHYFEQTQSRTDSVGGPHTFDDALDMRVAFSEGFADALSVMALYPNSIYTDTSGPNQASGLSFATVAPQRETEANPGWYSELSVISFFMDAFVDSLNNHPRIPSQKFGLGLIYDVFALSMKEAPFLSSLFSFAAGIKAVYPEWGTALSYYLGQINLAANVDGWATGETNAGNSPGSLPIYHPLQPDVPVTLAFDLSRDEGLFYPNAIAFNRQSANRFLRVVGAGGAYRIDLSCALPVVVQLYREGIVAEDFTQRSSRQGDTYTTTLTDLQIAAGQTLVLNVMASTLQFGSEQCLVALTKL